MTARNRTRRADRASGWGSRSRSPRRCVGRRRVRLRRRRAPRASSSATIDDHGQHAADRERAAARPRDQEGVLRAAGDRHQEETLQSGNDIVLALANNNGEIGYVGWVPAMIARTQGITITAVATSEVEGTNAADNWQNIMVKGSSSIQHAGRPRRQDDRRQRAQGRRRGDDQGGAEEGRRRPELGQAARAAVPGDAVGARQRPGRRGLDARAVPVPGAYSTAAGS